MSIESPISGPSLLTTKASEELPNSNLSQLEYKPQVPAPSEYLKIKIFLVLYSNTLTFCISLKVPLKNLRLAALIISDTNVLGFHWSNRKRNTGNDSITTLTASNF